MSGRIAVLVLCGFGANAMAAPGAAPKFQDLMDPSVFPEAQRGMTVESARAGDGALRIVTTGAEMALDVEGRGVLSQRIGHPRQVVSIRFEGGFACLPEVTHAGPGLAFARYVEPGIDVRANGDSLFMFHVHEPTAVVVERAINAGFSASFGCNHVLLDEWGGFGLYCSEGGFDDAFDPYGPVTARYELPADAVLWVGVCPPKPYDWERSLRDNVVWHWSNELGYPPDGQLVTWSKKGNICLLQSEIMLWKDWNLAFEPRLGEAEFARVRDTMHGEGMRFIVYTSPAYFFKGTSSEHHAFNSFDGFTSWPPSRGIGDNIDLFMEEITKVMREYKPDGLYFDGQYFNSPAALYALARRTRALLGEDGILEWHSTAALGHGLCSLPQADAYVDFILRGEGRDNVYRDFDYLRYFVSCYNSSNSIGVLCNNGPRPARDLVRRLLEANCRMHTIAGWLNDPALVDLLATEYEAKLTPALREQTERGADARQAGVAERAEILAVEQRALEAPPDWDAPILAESFETLPEWQQSVSPANDRPFSVQDGVLAITGKAHTYAFLTCPIGKAAAGFAVKVRQYTDSGMSWGPAACVRWKDGGKLRVGLRSDGLLQSDVNGQQRLGGKHDAEKWIWLRARWLAHSGVIEASVDGTDYHRLWTFTRCAMESDEVESISVGKVPYNCEPKDHSEPGAMGVCFAGELAVY